MPGGRDTASPTASVQWTALGLSPRAPLNEKTMVIPPYQLYEKIEREIPIVLLQRIPAGEDLARVRE
jgi:hypothetical protein